MDLSTAHGRAFLQMSAVWAEFSSALHSERMREVSAQAKRQGRSLNGRKQYGWKMTHPSATTPQPDYEERAVMAHIVWLRDERGLAWRKVADAVETRLAAKEGRKPIPHYDNADRRFGHVRCLRCYKAAKELKIQPADSL